MYHVVVTHNGMVVDTFDCADFETVCAYARLYWNASPLNMVTWVKE